jgi:hypothetical protein
VTECPVTDGFELLVSTVVVRAAFTVSASVPEVLLRKFASPLYLAVMECDRTARVPPAAVNCARPPEIVAEPICALPSKKVTVPVGTPPATARTVALKVTACPNVAGFAPELMLVAVAA